MAPVPEVRSLTESRSDGSNAALPSGSQDVTAPSPSQFYATMLGSAAAGVLARIPIHPIDTAKARIQSSASAASSGTATSEPIRYRNLLQTLLRTSREEGLRGLYRGFGITFAGSAPSACLYFTSYELSKEFLPRAFPSLAGMPSSVVHFVSGMVAETISCVFWVPIDVIKERMQIQRSPASLHQPTPAQQVYYTSANDAIRKILKGEGVRGIYRGYGATLASFGPFSALYFSFYEHLKAFARAQTNAQSDGDLPFLWQVGSASGAGAAASFLTSPLDLVKLRLQVQRGERAAAAANATAAGVTSAALPFHYRNIVDGLRTVIRTEGYRALFRGAGARMAFHAPSTALSLTLFERCKVAAADLLNRSDRQQRHGDDHTLR